MVEEVKPVEIEQTEGSEGVKDFNPFATREISNEDLAAEQPNHKAVEEKKEEVILDKETVTTDKPVVTEKPKEEAVANHTTDAPIVFKDEYSERLFNSIKDGKEDDLYEYLREKRELASVQNLSPEDQIKLNLKYQHPDYSQDEVDELFLESFSKPEAPEKPVQEDDELDEEFARREAKYNKELATYERKSKSLDTKISREAKGAVKSLTARQKELVLPDIPKKEQTVTEPTAEEIAKREADIQAALQSIDKGVKEFSGYKTVIKTDNNLEITVEYPIGDDEKIQLKEAAQSFDINEHFRPRWINEDGSYNSKAYADDIYWLTNRDKILQKVATQAANLRLEHHLKEQKNIDFSGGRQQAPTSSMSEKDKMADFFFSQR